MRLGTTKGLLTINNELVFVHRANWVAVKLGYICVEHLVATLERLKPWQFICPECGEVTEKGGSGHRIYCRRCSAKVRAAHSTAANERAKAARAQRRAEKHAD